MVGTPGRKDWGAQPTGSQNPSCAARVIRVISPGGTERWSSGSVCSLTSRGSCWANKNKTRQTYPQEWGQNNLKKRKKAKPGQLAPSWDLAGGLTQRSPTQAHSGRGRDWLSYSPRGQLSTERSWQMSNKGGSRLSAASCHLQPASSPHCSLLVPSLPRACQWPDSGRLGTVENQDGSRRA